MARLIDADALIDNMEMHVTTMSVCSTTIEARAKGEMKRTCIADAANAPTIDAIPVEWLREQCKVFDSMARGGHHSAWIIKALIIQWQKEQEAR